MSQSCDVHAERHGNPPTPAGQRGLATFTDPKRLCGSNVVLAFQVQVQRRLSFYLSLANTPRHWTLEETCGAIKGILRLCHTRNAIPPFSMMDPFKHCPVRPLLTRLLYTTKSPPIPSLSTILNLAWNSHPENQAQSLQPHQHVRGPRDYSIEPSLRPSKL